MRKRTVSEACGPDERQILLAKLAEYERRAKRHPTYGIKRLIDAVSAGRASFAELDRRLNQALARSHEKGCSNRPSKSREPRHKKSPHSVGCANSLYKLMRLKLDISKEIRGDGGAGKENEMGAKG